MRTRLGWFAVDDVALDVPGLYREYRHETEEKLPLWEAGARAGAGDEDRAHAGGAGGRLDSGGKP